MLDGIPEAAAVVEWPEVDGWTRIDEG